MTAVWDQIRVEPKIVRGQYVIAGDYYTRATTFAATIEDRFNLEKWFKRMTALGLVNRPDLVVQVAANHDDKKKLDTLVDEAIEAAKGSVGSNLGSALHLFAERVDRGEHPTIPAPYDADIAAYTATLTANGVHVDPNLMEGVVVLRDLKVAGRFDRIVNIEGFDLPLIADLKTGGIDFAMPTIATQLALYANADELYDPASDTTSPMPQVDRTRALVIHLPAGQATCTLHLVNIQEGWRAAQLCAQVRGWRKNRTLATTFATPDRRTWLVGRVQRLRDSYPDALATLAANWPAEVPTFKSGHPHTVEQLELVALAVSIAEAEHGVPFHDVDPARQRPDPETIGLLEERFRVLPADLVDALNTIATNAGLPNIRSRALTVAHLPDVEAILADAEKVAARRYATVATVFTELGVNDAEIAALCAACGSNGAWTAHQLEVLLAIRELAITTSIVFTDDGVSWPDAEGRLIDIYGTKREALVAVKTLADTFGIPRPRSIADGALNPALVALAATRAA